jgi:hypothetical protein
MFLRPSRIFRSRICRVLGIGFLLAAIWTAWWIWPPQPELRVRVQVPVDIPSGAVTADGRTLVCDRAPAIVVNPPKPHHLNTFDLRTGERRLDLTDGSGFVHSVSPDGSCLAYFEGQGENYWHLRALPSGKLIQSLPKIEPNSRLDWTPDGRYVLYFNPSLSVYRAQTGEFVGQYDVDAYHLALRPDGTGFVAPTNDPRELLVHAFDRATPDTTVLLPGPPAFDPRQPEKRPPPGSVSNGTLATNNDGSVIFTFLYRFHQEGDKDRGHRYLARWDRSTQQWTEADMGPACESVDIGANTLRLSHDCRYLTTKKILRGQFTSGIFERDTWGEEEAKKFVDRDLWDATSSPPRCLNDEGIPKGLFFFDPTGRRIIRLDEGDASGTHAVYDAETMALLSSQSIKNWDEPIFSGDGKWSMFSERDDPWNPSWLPDRVANWINQYLRLTDTTIRVVRLADGKTVRRLSRRSSPKFTTDGYLWTVTEASRSDDTAILLAERWSPEQPAPPWWLLLLSGGGFAGIVCDVRRGRRVNTERA